MRTPRDARARRRQPGHVDDRRPVTQRGRGAPHRGGITLPKGSTSVALTDFTWWGGNRGGLLTVSLARRDARQLGVRTRARLT